MNALCAMAICCFTASMLVASEPFPHACPPLAMPPAAVAAVGVYGPAPITEADRVRVVEGHFVDAAGRRVRLAGANITAGACFPDAATAERIAARLRAFGLNAVRIHHLDAPWAVPSIFRTEGMVYGQRTDAPDPAMAARLAGFLVALGRHGIYVDLNLKVTRLFQAIDGFPEADRLPDQGKVIGYFDERAIAQQERYARQVLAIQTADGVRLADLPNLAMVEINNEDSLLANPALLAALPPHYRDQLTAGWNGWLKRTYGSTTAMLAAWNRGAVPLGGDRLDPNSMWSLERQQDCTAQFAVTGTGFRLNEMHINGIHWHLQMHLQPIALTEGEALTLTFRARADRRRQVFVNVRNSEKPWGFVGLDTAVWLEPDWRDVSLPFAVVGTNGVPSRISFMAGNEAVPFEVTELRLLRGNARVLPAGQRVEDGTVALPEVSSTSPGADAVAYLMSVEAAYGARMRRLLVDELGVRTPIGLSQTSFGGLPGVVRESAFDFVDQHNYWDHPDFPNRWWDINDFRLGNTSMLRADGLGALDHVTKSRVAGRPATLTEYNHPAPNEYLAESVPLVFTTAALQDWDAVYLYSWSGDATWAKEHLYGFFDVANHPAQLAHLATFAHLFRSGELAPLTATRTLVVPLGAVPRIAAEGRWTGVWNDGKAEAVNNPFLVRSAVRFANGDGEPHLEAAGTLAAPQVRWDRTVGAELMTVDTPQLAAVIGFAGDREIALSGLRLRAERGQRGFVAVSVASADGQPLAQARRILLAAIDKAENAGWRWNAERTTLLGQPWEAGPVVVHGVAAAVTLPGRRVGRVRALAADGTVLAEVPTTSGPDGLSFRIDPAHHAVWYEIVNP